MQGQAAGSKQGVNAPMVHRTFVDLGGSAAQSTILMAIVIGLTVIQFRYIERRVQY